MARQLRPRRQRRSRAPLNLRENSRGRIRMVGRYAQQTAGTHDTSITRHALTRTRPKPGPITSVAPLLPVLAGTGKTLWPNANPALCAGSRASCASRDCEPGRAIVDCPRIMANARPSLAMCWIASAHPTTPTSSGRLAALLSAPRKGGFKLSLSQSALRTVSHIWAGCRQSVSFRAQSR